MLRVLICEYLGVYNPTVVYYNGEKCETRQLSLEETIQRWRLHFHFESDEPLALIFTTTKLFNAASQRPMDSVRSCIECLTDYYGVACYNGEEWLDDKPVIYDLLNYRPAVSNIYQNVPKTIEKLINETKRLRERLDRMEQTWNAIPEDIKALSYQIIAEEIKDNRNSLPF